MSGYDYAFFRRIVGTKGGGGYRVGPRDTARARSRASGTGAPDAFVCPSCGDGSPFEAECARCHVPMESASGHTPPVLASRVPALARRPLIAWKGLLALSAALVVSGGLCWFGGQYPGAADRPEAAALALVGLLLLLVNPTVEGIRGWLERSRIRRLVRRVARKLQEVEQVPIAQLTDDDPIQRVRGRVRVIEPAPGSDPRLAASLNDGLDRRCGRFEVVDETGSALVDDRHLELWDSGDPASPVAIRDGDEVEVIGPSERRVMPDRDGGRGYRDGVERHVFEHRDGVPVHVVLTEAEPSRGPRVRVAAEEEPEPVEAPTQRPKRRRETRR